MIRSADFPDHIRLVIENWPEEDYRGVLAVLCAEAFAFGKERASMPDAMGYAVRLAVPAGCNVSAACRIAEWLSAQGMYVTGEFSGAEIKSSPGMTAAEIECGWSQSLAAIVTKAKEAP